MPPRRKRSNLGRRNNVLLRGADGPHRGVGAPQGPPHVPDSYRACVSGDVANVRGRGIVIRHPPREHGSEGREDCVPCVVGESGYGLARLQQGPPLKWDDSSERPCRTEGVYTLEVADTSCSSG
ncbi:hypothetical protein SY2F82_29810 [Streptomyces sp. Y2F8-2]|nr:hypothetical protein SY2F82_29810 [Streptomyces sp. Y2F8-2]